MRLPDAVVRARFLERPSRFLVRAEHDDAVLDAFCPNPGRLGEFLTPGRPVLLAHHPSPHPASPGGTSRRGPPRKTVWDHIAFERLDRWFVVDTRVANALFREAFDSGALPELGEYGRATPEVRVGKSRFDFRLESVSEPAGQGAVDGDILVEVKSVSLFHEEGRDLVARFPDAPTTRGARHLRELAELAREGQACAAFFVIAAPGALRVEAFEERDPDFARALAEARDAGVRVLARESACDGREIRMGREVPVRIA